MRSSPSAAQIPPRLLTEPSAGARPQLKPLGKARSTQAAAAQQAEHLEQRSASALGRRLEEAEAKLSALLPRHQQNAAEQLLLKGRPVRASETSRGGSFAVVRRQSWLMRQKQPSSSG